MICLAVGYVCGLFQTSYIYGKKQGIDIREHGSGNAGSTNALRTLGKEGGGADASGELSKVCSGYLDYPSGFASHGGSDLLLLELYAGAGCILGHNFPFYLNFKGKGVRLLWDFCWLLTGDCFWFVRCCFSVRFFLTHYVSLGSLLAYLGFVIALIVFGQMGTYDCTQRALYEMYVVAAGLMLLAYWRHRPNIVRLLHGNGAEFFNGKELNALAKVSVLGAGSWETALAILLTQNGHETILWSHRQERAEELANKREHEAKTPKSPFRKN